VRALIDRVFRFQNVNISQMYQTNQVQLAFAQSQGNPTLASLQDRALQLIASDPAIPYQVLLNAILRNASKTSHRLIL
jgi:hypothetical protein